MSFNLNYVTQGLDFTAFGQGISEGLKQAAQYKLLREEQARKDVEQFRENYNTKNILAKDIADFTTAFEDYKTKALELSRLNKGRSNSQKLAEATKAKEFALNKMNSIYSQSAKVNQYAKYLADYSDQLSKSKYRVPSEVSDKMNYILKTPSSLIKDEDMIDPRTIKVGPNANDIRTSQILFNSIEKGIDQDVTENIPVTVPGIGDVNIKTITKFKYRNPATVLSEAGMGLAGMDYMDNQYQDEANALKQALSITETDIIENESLRPIKAQAEAQLVDLKNKLGNDFDPLNTDDQTLKAALYANDFGGFDRMPQGTSSDKSEFERALRLRGLKDKDKRFTEALSQFDQKLELQRQGLGLRAQSNQLAREKFEAGNKKKTSLADLMKARMSQKKG